MAGSTIPERVAQLYYTYGLFCSSYPVTAIVIASSVVLMCCFPLLNVPLPGNIPTVVKLPMSADVKVPMSGEGKAGHNGKVRDHCNESSCQDEDESMNLKYLFNQTQRLPYPWTKEKPYLYVQQIILKTGVSPWNSNMRMWDAFRAPIQESFRLLETIRNHEDPQTKTTLGRHCFQIDNIKRGQSKDSIQDVLPEYSCLLLSPANLWQQNLQTFSLDSNIVNTIFNYQNLHRGKVSFAEMAFGMHLKDAGIKRYPLRSRPRVLQFAVTIFYDQPDDQYINSLIQVLKKTYPLHEDNQYKVDYATLIYYPGQFNYHELVPLLITFLGLFVYIYFSVRKIEFIKSKFGLAACAVLTIACSLSMSMGLCFYFGFSLSLQGKEIFPYLIIIVGLENVLVLTKSVTSTDSYLDVKIRLAQGLSKEGWSITKNLLVEITIFTLGFLTFVPFIQEFSIFMIVSLVSDYFVQMIFFATILGIDVRHMECFQDQNNRLHLKDYHNSFNALNWQFNRQYLNEYKNNHHMKKSMSHPRLNGLAQNSPTDVVAMRKSYQEKVPKRVRLVNMWARTRFFQRAFMIWMIVWISMIIYNSGIVDYFVTNAEKNQLKRESNKKDHDRRESNLPIYQFFNHSSSDNGLIFSPFLRENEKLTTNINDSSISLLHTQHLRPWTKLLPYHWSSILSQYNESLSGRFIVILPPQLLSCRITPEMAVSIRNIDEKDPPPLRWQALAAALDPIDITPDFDIIEGINQAHPWSKAMSATELPIYPTTPMEILLLAVLCGISLTVIVYMMVVLYRCVCSRNYAEWRASWNNNEEYLKILAKQPAVQLVMEAVPLVVPGHNHEIECLVTDGEKIVSTCLQHSIKIWDSQNGELIRTIHREVYFNYHNRLQKIHLNENNPENIDSSTANSTLSDKEGDKPAYGSVHKPRKHSAKCDLHKFKFTSQAASDEQSHLFTGEKTKYDLAKSYSEFYCYRHHSENSYEAKENADNNDHQKRDNNDNKCNDLDYKADKNKTKSELRNRQKKKIANNDNYISMGKTVDDIDLANVTNLNWKSRVINESPIWCIDYCNDLIIIGCADGRLEFWETYNTCRLVCVWWSTHGEHGSRGITHIRALGGARRLCAATLSGHLIMLRLDAINHESGSLVDWSFSTAYRRTHKRTGSTGSIYKSDYFSGANICKCPNEELNNHQEIHCTRIAHCRAHLQPITEMQVDGGVIMTGGQDHIIKVFSSSNLSQLFIMHGHCGPITCCFIDHSTPTIAGSGSQDGLLCVWDLLTGTCLYGMQAHDGAVTSLAYTASYVISAGADEKLCIWDRFQGHMLNSIYIGLKYMSTMLPLTHTLLLIGDRGGLAVYDLSNGEVIKRVFLGDSDVSVFVHQILPLKDAIVCEYENQLRIVRFPLVSRFIDTKDE